MPDRAITYRKTMIAEGKYLSDDTVRFDIKDRSTFQSIPGLYLVRLTYQRKGDEFHPVPLDYPTDRWLTTLQERTITSVLLTGDPKILFPVR